MENDCMNGIHGFINQLHRALMLMLARDREKTEVVWSLSLDIGINQTKWKSSDL